MSGPGETSTAIAIIGSVIVSDNETVREQARGTAREFGRQLALAKLDIVVYSSHPNSLETYVVGGYVASGQAAKDSIHVLYPSRNYEIDFPGAAAQPHLFDWQADTSPDWEISFYESLHKVDGMLILGGARSTLIAGLIGIAQLTPIVALRTSGGSAETIWAQLGAKHTLLTRDQHAFLGRPTWDSAAIGQAVQLFAAQRECLKQRAAAHETALRSVESDSRRGATAAIILLLVSLTMIALTVSKAIPSVFMLGCLLILGPVIAGGAGATIRRVADLLGSESITPPGRLYQKAALGLAAGAVSALLAILPQLFAEPHIPDAVKLTLEQKDEMRRDQFDMLAPLAMLTAFIAGFAADRFYQKLREVQISSIELPKS